ncbi:MAG: pyridoxal phosphate-dependent class II aminotransferase [Desulfitobacteriaceae bacterium]|nr:pyridoxal phosphate-dependent class II aminotransferase [Desulfitobacteriaceae bacterium]
MFDGWRVIIMHGGNLRRARELYGQDSFLDLSANINPFGPPESVWDKIRETLPQIVNYPDPESKQLRSELASVYQLPVNKIMVGNGAGELLFTLLQSLKPKKVAIPTPSFSEYEQAARAASAEIFYIPLGAQGWSGLSPVNTTEERAIFRDIWQQHLNGCDLLFICSPHNPTGSLISKEHFQLLLEISRGINCHIIFDESFFDFLPEETRWSARLDLEFNPQLIVLYSMTKFYSLPGLRLGACFASSDVISHSRLFRDPWSVNVLAEQAGIAALQDKNFPALVRRKLNESKKFFTVNLKQSTYKSLKVLPGSANFVLVELLDHCSGEFVKALANHGILVRDCANFKGLQGSYIRIAIKDISSMKHLLNALSLII